MAIDLTNNEEVCADMMLNGSTLQLSETRRLVYVGDLEARGEVLENGKWQARTTKRLTEREITEWTNRLQAEYRKKLEG